MQLKWTEDDLLTKLGNLVDHYRRMPTLKEFDANPGPRASVFRRRMGTGFYAQIERLVEEGYCDGQNLTYFQDILQTVEKARKKMDDIHEDTLGEEEQPEETSADLGDPGQYVSRKEFLRILDQLRREKNKTRRIIETDRACISALPVPRLHYSPTTISGDMESAVLCIGDVHGGEDVTTNDTLGRNRYDMSITEERLAHIVPKVRLLTDLERKSRPIEELVIFLLGDIIDGEVIFAGQPFYINAPAISQVRQVGRFISQMVNDLSDFFPRVRVETVVGNHGRASQFGTGHYLSNWDAVLYDQVTAELKNNKRVVVNNHESPIAFTQVNGLNFGFSHGAYLSGGASIKPSTAAERAAERWPALLNIQVDETEVFANGSVVGGNFYSTTKIRRTTSPKQWFFCVHPRRVTCRYKIDFLDCLSEVDEAVEFEGDPLEEEAIKFVTRIKAIYKAYPDLEAYHKGLYNKLCSPSMKVNG